MNKFYDTVQDERGVVLPGYRVQVVTSAGDVVDIFADRGGTRFTDAAGNTVNYATADGEGLAEFFYTAADGQIAQILKPNGDLFKSIDGFADNFVLDNLPGNISQDAITGLDASLADKADNAALAADTGAALIGTADGDTVQQFADRSPIIVSASGVGFASTMTAAAFNAALAALVTKWGGATVIFDLDVGINGAVTIPAQIDVTAKAEGATLYATGAATSFVTVQGEARIFGPLTIDGRSLATSHVLKLDTNAVARDLRGLKVAGDGRPAFTGVKATDDAAWAAAGTSVAAVQGLVGIETRDNVTGVIEDVTVWNVGLAIQVNRSTHDLIIRGCNVFAYVARGISGRGGTAGITISDITVENCTIGQALAGVGPRYPITFYFVGEGRPRNITIRRNVLTLGHRPYITGAVSSNNGTADSINFHGVRGGVIEWNFTIGTGEAGITVSQGSENIDVISNFIGSADTACISIGPSGLVNRNIRVLNNTCRMASLDLNNDHGSQPFISFINVENLTYGGNKCVRPRKANIVGATQANPVVLAVAGPHDFIKGDPVDVAGIGGMTQLNAPAFSVLWVDGLSIALADRDGNAIDGTGFSAYTTGGTLQTKDATGDDPDYGIKFWEGGTEKLAPTVTNLSTLGGNTIEAFAPSLRVTAVTQASPAVATVEGVNSVVTGDFIALRGSNVADYNGVFKVSARSATTLTLANPDGTAFDSSGFAAFTGTATIEQTEAATPAVPLFSKLTHQKGTGHRSSARIEGTGIVVEKDQLFSASAKTATGVYTVDFKFPIKTATATPHSSTPGRTATVEITGPRQVTVRTAVTNTNAAVDLAFVVSVSE